MNWDIFGSNSLFNQIVLFSIAGGIIILIVIGFLFFRKDILLKEIESAFEQKQYKRVVDLSLVYLKKKTGSYILYFYIAQSYEKLNQLHLSIENYEKALANLTGYSNQALYNDILLKMGELYQSINRWDTALGYYKLIIKNQPRNLKALWHLSEIYFDLKKYPLAKDILEKYTVNKPEDGKAHLLLAKVYNHTGDYNKSINEIKRYFETFQNISLLKNNETIMIMADNYLALKRYREVVTTLNSFLEDKIIPGDVLLKIAIALIKSGEFDKAADITTLHLSNVANQDRCRVLYEIAKEYFSFGEIYMALDVWRTAYQINANYLDLEIIMKKFEVLYRHKELSKFYANKDNVFEEFAMKRLNLTFTNNILERQKDFWIFKDNQFCSILYRFPHPLAIQTLNQVEDILKRYNFTNITIQIFTLFGMNDDCKKTMFYKKIKEISGVEFLNVFIGG